MRYPMVLDSLYVLRTAMADVIDKDIIPILDIIESRYPEVQEYCRKISPAEEDGFSGMCLEASRFFNQMVKDIGGSPRVLQGDIPLGQNSWLEHHVSLVCTPSTWLIVDFTAGQLKHYSGLLFIVLLIEPNRQALADALRRIYGWWIPETKGGN